MGGEIGRRLRMLLRLLDRLPMIAGTALASIAAAVALLHLTYNSTPSLPIGVYQVRPLGSEPRRGDVVGFCLERKVARLALARGYVHPEGLERFVYRFRCGSGAAVIGKPVAGVPGDMVEIRTEAVWINGAPLPRSVVREVDSSGRPLPQPHRDRRVLGSSEYWLQSTYSDRSFDSRYYGPVERRQIGDHRTPLLVR